MTTLSKEQASLGMPWEEQYGYAQAVKVGDTIYLSGQVSHDDAGNVMGVDDMEIQMRSAYGNIAKVLAQYDATMENLVEETLYVLDMEAAFDARVKMKDEVFSGQPLVASTIVQIDRLAFPEFLVEIRCIARV
jgi:2-iminobutanoate/2-iminopropanoate deaminase